MSDSGGLTSIDTFFELLGMQAAGRMADFFQAIWLPVLAALGSIAVVYARSIERGMIRPVLLYFFYAAFAGFLTGPASVRFAGLKGEETLRTPRAVFYMNRVCDAVTAGVSNRFAALRGEMDKDQAGFVLRHVRIRDEKLRQAARYFIHECLGPELAARSDDGRDVEPYLMHPFLVREFRVPEASSGHT